MSAKVSKVCLGKATQLVHNGDEVPTGIYKSVCADTVVIDEMGIVGDEQVDLRFHGGRDKALYVYPDAHYEFWAAELNRSKFEDAQFGENINVSLLDDESVVIGDRYQLGTAVVEVTQPRIPCFKLGIRLQDESFPAKFLAAGRLGFYLRVLEGGGLKQGDRFDLLEKGESRITVADLWRITFTDVSDSHLAKRALNELAYLDEGWRKRLKRRAEAG